MWLLENDQYRGEVENYSRAAQFGDGLFETLSVQDGQVLKRDLHAQRLEKGMAALGMHSLSVTTEEWLEEKVAAILHHTRQSTGIVKVMVTRAPSARGYAYDASAPIQSIVSLSTPPNLNKAIYEAGIDVIYCNTHCSIQPTLAGIKHLNRLENVLARQEVVNAGTFEGLMLDANGFVIEGTMSNVFFCKGDVWYTPELYESGVAGVMRQFIMNQSSTLSLQLEAGKIHQEDLKTMDAAFICNSILGVVPIKRVEEKIFEIDESLIKMAKQFRIWGGNE
ncbi:aminodeoxychorismate lyase [Bermanella marisrubri]|uniref:Aminodeoxychorismate lyase n=1 Tax=Bermanella marisrubri TaxID=207949 RepID=Q1N4U6_9GAMM|nr:aminodeoxychorismate lyase [Bermanella marisrubri]EAT13332.1 Aminotransferase, class IV [Oceanobacter sp. RED65] [Bermanella marisrubri]QIZ84091.1 aminodeoxychorismate lyase [Bermanella marisrubri]